MNVTAIIAAVLGILKVLAKPAAIMWERWEKRKVYREKLKYIKIQDKLRRKKDELLKKIKELPEGDERKSLVTELVSIIATLDEF